MLKAVNVFNFLGQRNALIVGQSATEAVLRSHIEKYSCHVELATRLQSFEQKSDHVVARLVRTTDDGREVPETLSASFLVGSDGARGTLDVACNSNRR
jgi:2-polyprenyl-6-methoxyphenol hydroxylase-like FAD-dependent oxidoreductase